MKKIPQPRADVAELLRQGATYRTIGEQLGVTTHVISATRKAYDIPPPTGGRGRRLPPSERACIEERVVTMLRQGATYAVIKAEVGVSQPTVLRIRRKHRIPLAVRVRPARSVVEVFALHAEAYGEDHTCWTGPWSGRTPTLNAEGQHFNARHVAFRAHHGRDPDGYVRATCTEPGCMTGAHLADTAMRAGRRAVPAGGEA